MFTYMFMCKFTYMFIYMFHFICKLIYVSLVFQATIALSGGDGKLCKNDSGSKPDITALQ